MRQRLETSLIMFYLGGTRSASAVLVEQATNVSSSTTASDNLKAMVQQAHDLRREISVSIDAIGPYLHEGWVRKKSLAKGISNPQIDAAYDRALAAGATGGKLLGAGASGFLLVYAPGDARFAVHQALREYPAYSVQIDMMGASIIFSD
jgi:D-glycero-alpha-D-manno-heptose-7-phosphate kinase